ncbi:cytochrome P450 [Mycena vitilis]|nr:cytochrome P450 [Mycena vitilis]
MAPFCPGIFRHFALVPPAVMLILNVYGLLSGVLVIYLVSCILSLRRRHSRLPLPPGPKKLPLIGNLLDFPKARQWETFMQWSKIYDSDILHLDAAGTSMIILSSARAVHDLLEQRSSVYSDRPRLTMLNELMGWDFSLGLMPYGDHWLAHRKLVQNAVHPTALPRIRPVQVSATHELLRRTQQDQDHILDHARQCVFQLTSYLCRTHSFSMAGRIIMSVAYGIDVLPNADPYIASIEAAVDALMVAAIPGQFLVDFLPILKYIPGWIPGAGFKRTARKWKEITRRAVNAPFAETTRRIACFTLHIPNCLFTSVSVGNGNCYAVLFVKSAAGSMYTAAVDPMVSTLGTFILAMLSNPEAQRNAQLEIDSVLRGERLPQFEDEAALPYVSALLKEVLRWRNVTPIAIPHSVSVEDEYRGYRIPVGSIVIGNVWYLLVLLSDDDSLIPEPRAICHDELVYPEPFSFKPERFLSGNTSDPDAVFGFGRRQGICPGKHMAVASIWIAIVSMLAVFDITKAVGEDGEMIEPTHEYSAGLAALPLPFKCSIKPRSVEAAMLIRATLSDP